MSLKIRTFQPADTEAVRQLFAAGQLEFAKGLEIEDAARSYIEHSLQDDLADIPAHYLNQPDHHFWVAELDGQIKGMVAIQRRNAEEAELRRMSVSSDVRRQGIGRKLLETTEAFCRQHGYQRIFLTTVSHLEPAIAMYHNFGYQQVSEQQYGSITGQSFIKSLTNDS